MIPEAIRQFVSYDPITGVLTWISRPSTCLRQGSVAGSRTHDGYLNIGFRGARYANHRVAWFLMTAQQPPDTIDHRDLNRTNNAWANLRAASFAQNSANTPVRRTGLKGVTRLPNGRYQAQIKKFGVGTYLGSFDTEDEAHAAYVAKARELFGNFARAA